MTEAADLIGLWESRYQYESGGQRHESTHVVNVSYYDDVIMAVNQPETTHDSAISLTLTVDERELRGTWEERTDVHGKYGGQIMNGLLHLALDETGVEAAGFWTGMSRSGVIKSGKWVLRRVMPES